MDFLYFSRKDDWEIKHSNLFERVCVQKSGETCYGRHSFLPDIAL